MIPRWFLALTLTLSAHAKEISATIFDMPPVAGGTIRAEAFGDMLPVSLFSVRKDMDQKALMAALTDCRMEYMRQPSFSPWVRGETPERAHFEHMEAQWEDKKLMNFRISAYRLPPTQGRLRVFVMEFGRLLGEPTAAYRQKRYDREQPLSLILEWRKGTDVMRLGMMRDGESFEIDLVYYPGPENPGLARVNAADKPEALPAEPLDKRMAAFMEAIAFLPPGDGARPPIPLPEGERDMLAACSSVGAIGSIIRNRDWIEHRQPFREKLHEALGKHYADLKPRERYARLLRIAEGKEPGLSSGEVQVGAAYFLGTHTDPAAIDFLLAGMDVELPSGVEMECAAGIARQCAGETMDRVISMFEIAGQGDKAASILSKMDTPEQLKELKAKARKAIRPVRSRLGNIVDYLEDHGGIE